MYIICSGGRVVPIAFTVVEAARPLSRGDELGSAEEARPLTRGGNPCSAEEARLLSRGVSEINFAEDGCSLSRGSQPEAVRLLSRGGREPVSTTGGDGGSCRSGDDRRRIDAGRQRSTAGGEPGSAEGGGSSCRRCGGPRREDTGFQRTETTIGILEEAYFGGGVLLY